VRLFPQKRHLQRKTNVRFIYVPPFVPHQSRSFSEFAVEPFNRGRFLQFVGPRET
jgi:hypothetical protein